MTEASLTRQQAILESFTELVQAPYGDFAGIGKLSYHLNDAATLQQVLASLNQIPQCQQALYDRPMLGPIDLLALHQLAPGTLGFAYADHMIQQGLKVMSPNQTAADPISFLGLHIGETHDIWHVVTGCNTDKPGEVQLEAFYVAQLSPDRLFLALLAKNLLKTAMDEIYLCDQIMDALSRGWRMGKQAKPLFGIRWNTLWETPLQELRNSLEITLD